MAHIPSREANAAISSSNEAAMAAKQPPPGDVVNFSATNTLYAPNIAIQVIIVFLTTTLVVLRCWVRKNLLGLWELEDWLCVLSWALFMSLIAFATVYVQLGGGKEQWDIRESEMPRLLYWNNLCEVYYNVVIATTKGALLYMYLSIFAPRRYSRNWWAIAVVFVANTLFYFISFWIKLFICVPREAIWDKSVPNAHCIVGLFAMLNTTSAWNTLSDIFILLLPTIFISKLQLQKRKKIGIIFIFTVGAIAPIFSIIGIYIRVAHAGSPNMMYWQARILLFSEAEITTGVICNAMPPLQRLFKGLRRLSVGKPHLSRTSRTVSGKRRSLPVFDGRSRRTITFDEPCLRHPSEYQMHPDTSTSSFGASRASQESVIAPIRPAMCNHAFAAGSLVLPVSEFENGQIWKTTEVDVVYENSEQMTYHHHGDVQGNRDGPCTSTSMTS